MENTNQFIVIKKVLVSMSGGEQILLYPVKTDEVTWVAQDERISVRFTRKAINGIWAFYADITLKDGFLDGEKGIEILLELPEECSSFLADYRYKEYWCQPGWTSSFSGVPDETQALLWKYGKGGYGFLLPVCGKQYKTILNGDRLRIVSWYDGLSVCSSLIFTAGEDENPGRLTAACVKEGLALQHNGYQPRTEKRYPEIFEYLGWCSWDAFQIRVSEKGLLDKCREFRDKDIPVRWVIIDDMWGDVKELYDVETPDYETVLESRHGTALFSFEADPIRFPEGLKNCIMNMEQEFGIKTGIWHPMSGYWSGIDKNGPLALEYGDCLIEGANGQLVPSFHQDKAFRFFDAYHRFLKDCGAQFVKIDNQSTIKRFYQGLAPVGIAAEGLHIAMEASAGIHFDNQLINCMGMASENMWNRPISSISRCSDDFLPYNREWFRQHILQCAYNSFIQGEFLWCDWDMWWTSDGQAVKNSVLRAVSGGPIYISDKVGESSREILMPLILSDGRILRCDRPGVPAEDCLMEDPGCSGKPFKVYSTCNTCIAAAVFHLNPESGRMNDTIGLTELGGTEKAEEYAVFEYFSKERRVIGKEERIPVTLTDEDDFRFYCFVPVEDGFAPLGLSEKYIAPKTIAEYNARTVVLKEGGTFEFFSRNPVDSVLLNGITTPVEKEAAPFYKVFCGGNGIQSVTVPEGV